MSDTTERRQDEGAAEHSPATGSQDECEGEREGEGETAAEVAADSEDETPEQRTSADDEEGEPEPGLWPVERLKPVLEALLFAAADAIQVRRICQIIDGATRPEVAQALEYLQKDCEERGFRLIEVAGGWQFRTAPEHHETVRKLFKEKPQRLTRAQMEVLTIIVYKQPATRAEVEVVRGVDSSSVMEALVERRIVKIAGRRDVLGRPLVYVTTQEFLELFGLKDLRALPALPELGDDIQTMADRSGFNDTENERDAAVLPLEEGDTGEELQGQSDTAQTDREAGSQDHQGGEDVEGAEDRESHGREDGDDGFAQGDETFDGPPLQGAGAKGAGEKAGPGEAGEDGGDGEGGQHRSD